LQEQPRLLMTRCTAPTFRASNPLPNEHTHKKGVTGEVVAIDVAGEVAFATSNQLPLDVLD